MVKSFDDPVVTKIALLKHDPFKILIATVLSLRTKDSTTAKACARLFAKADTPFDMPKLSCKQIEKLIYPVGFYRVKAKNVLKICKILRGDISGKRAFSKS